MEVDIFHVLHCGGKEVHSHICKEEKFAGGSNSHCRIGEVFILQMEDWDPKLGCCKQEKSA